MSAGGGAWHEFQTVKSGSFTQQQVFCGGKWYEVGTSPCERLSAEQKADFLANLPACETDEDIAALSEVLGKPIGRCYMTGRASWNDVITSPPQVEGQAIDALIQQYERRIMRDLIAP